MAMPLSLRKLEHLFQLYSLYRQITLIVKYSGLTSDELVVIDTCEAIFADRFKKHESLSTFCKVFLSQSSTNTALPV